MGTELWNVGSLFAHDEYTLTKANRTNIESVFGCIKCLWQGGRFGSVKYDVEDVSRIVGVYNSLGIKCLLTMSSPYITEEDLSDIRCNRILDAISDGDNGVMLSSDILYDYIKKSILS